MSSPAHLTQWEDASMAATWCVAAHKPGPILHAGDPETCEHCGATLTLHWNVYVETTPNANTDSAVQNPDSTTDPSHERDTP